MLLFDVSGQTLKRTDHFNPATDSVEYLKAKFTFNDTAWSGKTKTALFRLGNAVYKSVVNASGVCKVPAEVLVGGVSRLARLHGETIYISLLGEYSTTRITTNEVGVKLNRSGYGDAETPADPTESEYAQMTAVAADAVAEAEAARTECETARADLVGVKNLFANAIKGNLSGAVVFADDVSPVEHNPFVWVHGKNIFNGTLALGYYWDSKDNLVDTASAIYRSFEVFLKKGTYTLSASVKICVLRHYVDGVMLYPLHYGTEYTFAVKNDGVVAFSIREATSAVWDNSINIQLERGESATDYTAYIDPTTTTAKRCGKNLLPNSGDSYTLNGLTFTTNSDGSITVSGTATKTTTHIFTYYADVVNGERYILSGCPSGGGTGKTYVLRCYNSLGDETVRDDEGNGVEFLFENAGGSYNFAILVISGVTINATFYPMLRLASVADETYEPYNGEECSPGENGVVADITSTSPNMTILTDTENVIVECEYIRDSNAVIDRIVNAIKTLGGTV